MEEAAASLLDTLTLQNSIKLDKISSKTLEIKINEFTNFLKEAIAPKDENSGTDDDKNEVLFEENDESSFAAILEALDPILETNIPFESPNLQFQIENLLIIEGSSFHMFHETLFFVSGFLESSKNEKSVEFVVSLIEKILKSNVLFSSIISACKPQKMSEIEAEEFDSKFRNFVQILVSLPLKISNKLKGRVPETFYLQNFAKIISFHIIRVISLIHEQSSQKIHFNLKKISTIISKILLNFESENFQELTEILICLSLENEEMSRLIQEILSNIERRSIESIAILLLKNIKNPNDVERIFGNLLENENWKYVLTKKIVFFSYYKDDKLIINLVTYLSRTWSRKLFVELIIKLLDIWGDKSALNHTSFDQHEFITKIILLSLNKISGKVEALERDAVQKLLFPGIAAHMEDMQGNIRALGMITGELIIDRISDPDAPKLKYDYSSIPEENRIIVKKLKDFWMIKSENIENSSSKAVKSSELIEKLGIEAKISSNFNEDEEKSLKENLEPFNEEKSQKFGGKSEEKAGISKKAQEEVINDADDSLDSDDDLLPYDMSNDTKITASRPLYLRELKEILTNPGLNNDPDIFSESLKCAEGLITAQLSHDDAALALELLLIFSKLREASYVENFNFLKFRACVSITKIYPKESAEFLCKEFHAKIGSNSVSDRCFFLSVLGEAAKELSKIGANETEEEKKKKKEEEKEEAGKTAETAKNRKKRKSKPFSLLLDLQVGKKIETLYDEDFNYPLSPELRKAEVQDAKNEIIEQRIASKTRVFAHASHRPQTTINKFNDLVSFFFYPLLYGLHKEEKSIFNVPKNFEDQGNILLINFLKTLCTIMLAAENCVLAPKIGRDMLELSWNLRYHKQAEVRFCVIESIAAVIIAVPKDQFTVEITELLLELRMWLEDVSQETFRGDPCAKCREMGKNVISLIDYDSSVDSQG